MLYQKSSEALALLNYTPKIYLFASNVFYHFHTYNFYKLHPEASGIDSLIVNWSSIQNADWCTSFTYFLETSTIPTTTSIGPEPLMEKVKFARLWISRFLT